MASKGERTPANDVSRREFVGGAAAVCALFALGGAGRAFASDGKDLLRPPGAQDEQRLLGLCMRCDRCRSVCPHNAIDVVHLEDGIVQARLPKMNFHLGFCDFCDGELRCAQVCPSGAIARGFNPSANRIGVAVIDHNECLIERFASGCSKQCIAACAYDALSLLPSGTITVDTDACNGCGACEYACPSASLGSYSGSYRRGINVEFVGSRGE